MWHVSTYSIFCCILFVLWTNWIKYQLDGKVGDSNRGQPEGPLFNSYYTEMQRRRLRLSLDCSTLPFQWSLSDSKSPQVSMTLLSILAVLNNAVVWMVSTRPPTSKFSSPFYNPLVTVPKAQITMGIIVTFMFHHVVPLARISLTLSRHFALSLIGSGRSSGQHPVSSHSFCMYVRAGPPAFDWPYAGVHRSTSLMSSSLLLQQCPACLVRLSCIAVWEAGGRIVGALGGVTARTCSILLSTFLPLIRTLYCWVLSMEESSIIFKVFDMTRSGIEPRCPGSLANTLPTRLMSRYKKNVGQ